MLTAKQEAFCNAIVDGMNQSDAYRHAYNAENMTPEVIHVKACELMKTGKVSVILSEKRAAIASAFVAKRVWDLGTIVDEFETNVYGAREDKQWSASNAAITGIGKALGILADKVDVNVTHTLKPGLSLEELEARMERLDALEAGVIEGEVVDES